MDGKHIVVLSLLICGIAFLSWYFPDPVFYVFSGSLFGDSRIITGGALDQPSLHKYLFLLLLFGIPSTLFLAAQRIIASPENNRVFRWAFIALSAIFYSHTISLLAAFTYHVSRYTVAMGPTTPRLLGVTCSVASNLLIAYFLLWLWGYRFPRRAKRG